MVTRIRVGWPGLCMLTTVFDPSQFGGRFFLIGQHNVRYTVFSELIERWLRISQRRGGEDRPVYKRFEDFKRIVGCLVKDFGMPINIQGGSHYLDEHHPAYYLLDWAALLGSWMAFAVFLEYFPELKNGRRFFCRWNPFHVPFGEPRPSVQCGPSIHFRQIAALHVAG